MIRILNIFRDLINDVQRYGKTVHVFDVDGIKLNEKFL
jgi:hypothetical protein